MKCIFCPSTEGLEIIEHIVPESLGNKDYIMDNAKVCGTCNAKFKDFENKAQYNTILGYERARLGHKSKRNKPAKGLINGMEWTANIKGEKNLVKAKGVNPDFFKKIGSDLYELRIPMYDKTNVPISKLLLKIGIESIYNSLPEIAKKYDFSKAKSFLKGEKFYNWPYLIPKTYVSNRFNDFLNSKIANHLKKIGCRLSYRVYNGYLLFRFKYGGFTGIICLNSTDIDWIENLQKEKQSKFVICPENFKKLTNV